jgi:hypothetical protein
MSQIDILSENESRTKKRKREVPTYNFQTPLNVSSQRSKFIFETSCTVTTARVTTARNKVVYQTNQACTNQDK